MRLMVPGMEDSSNSVYEAIESLKPSVSPSLAAVIIATRYATLGCGLCASWSSRYASWKGRHCPSGEVGGMA